MEKKYLNTKEVATLLGVSERTLQLWKKKQLLVPKTIGGKLFYTMDDIENAFKKAGEPCSTNQ